MSAAADPATEPHAQPPPRAIITAQQRILLLAVREAMLIALRAVEDYLGMPRSVAAKRDHRS